MLLIMAVKTASPDIVQLLLANDSVDVNEVADFLGERTSLPPTYQGKPRRYNLLVNWDTAMSPDYC